MRVFLDANILFSASNSGSLTYETLFFLKDHVNLVTNLYALDEVERNIHKKYPQWINVFETWKADVEIVQNQTMALPVDLNEKDAPILSTAIKERCDYLITDDLKDFGHLYNTDVEGVEIVTMNRFLEIFNA